jgi:hypothetical protein
MRCFICNAEFKGWSNPAHLVSPGFKYHPTTHHIKFLCDDCYKKIDNFISETITEFIRNGGLKK